MAPRVGFFAWLEAGDVLVRQWDPMLESLTQCADADEEERYVLGARRFDFDAGQGTYPLHAAQSKWGPLVSHIDRALVARLEPIGKMISSFEVRKYKLEDKFAKQAEEAGAEGKKSEGDEEMSDVSAASGPASSAAESSAAAAATAASGSSAAAAPSPSDSASASAPADAKSSSSKFTAAPSTSFYSRVPTPAALVAASGIPKSDTAARAALLSSLHMDQTPLLESLLSTHFAPAAAAAAASGAATGDVADPCLGLLGELQFAFIAFLIGQDAEGFEAWKALTTLLCSCVSALQTRHALYERWVAVFAAQLAELPRDFFIDVLSGENFLGPSLQRLFDAAVEPDLAIPASLSYALRELAEMVRRHFHAAPPKHPLPGFRSADPATMALQAAAAAAAAAAAPGPEAATAVEEKEAKQKAGADPLLTDEQRRAAEARQRRELLQRLQAEADEDEYAPTVADEDM